MYLEIMKISMKSKQMRKKYATNNKNKWQLLSHDIPNAQLSNVE